MELGITSEDSDRQGLSRTMHASYVSFPSFLHLSFVSTNPCSLEHTVTVNRYELRFLPLEESEGKKWVHQSLGLGVASMTKVKDAQTSVSKASLLDPGVTKDFSEEVMPRPGPEAKRVIITDEAWYSQITN